MPKLTPPDTIDFWVAQVSRLHYTRVHALMADLGLFPGQPAVLFQLWEKDGRSQSELAAALCIRPATLTKMINRMEKAGFVRRAAHPGDQRVSLIFLTDAGRAVKAQVEQIFERMNAELLVGFGPEEQVLLRRYLRQLRDNLQRTSDKQEVTANSANRANVRE